MKIKEEIKVNGEKENLIYRKLKRNKGITLIALVVTIIVLLILAGISIQMLVGEGGILTNAKDARDRTNIQDIMEQVQMDIAAKKLEKNGEDITEDELKSILKKYGELLGKEGQSILEQTLKTDKGEIKVSDIYNGKIKESGLTADDIYTEQAKYYGGYVKNYPVDINGDGDITKDWKVFYVEDYQGEIDGNEYYNTQQSNKPTTGKRIFLIAADYVGNNCEALTKEETGALKKSGMSQGIESNEAYDCNYYWKSSLDYTYHCTLPNEATSETRACEFPSLFEFTGYNIKDKISNTNSKCASALLCTENWKEFANNKYADFAIGGPTIEMWCDSWNKYYNNMDEETKKLFQEVHEYGNSSNGSGYYVANTESSTSSYDVYVTKSGSKFDSDTASKNAVDTLYFSHPGAFRGIADIDNDDDRETCCGYWLASPCAKSEYYVLKVQYEGKVGYDLSTNFNFGIRPVVCLKSNVQLKKDKEGNYTLIL